MSFSIIPRSMSLDSFFSPLKGTEGGKNTSISSSPSSTSLPATNSSTTALSSFQKNAGRWKIQVPATLRSSPQEKALKDLKKTTLGMLSDVTSKGNQEAILSAMYYGIGVSAHDALANMKKEAKGNGSLRRTATVLQNFVTIGDLAKATGKPLSPEMQAFVKEAGELLNAPINAGSKEVPFSQWATTKTYAEGVLSSGWDSSAQTYMREHLGKIEDFANRYRDHKRSAFSQATLASGAYLRQIQQNVRRNSSASVSSDLPPLTRTNSAPPQLESASAMPQFGGSLNFGEISTFSPRKERFEYGGVSTFSPFSPARARRGSAPARMEVSDSSNYKDPSAVDAWRRQVHTQTQSERQGIRPSPIPPAASPIANSPSFNSSPPSVYPVFNTKVNELLHQIQTDPGLQHINAHVDAYLALETEFETNEHAMHPIDRDEINDRLQEISKKIFQD